MYIKKLIIENLRSFEKAEINFSQGITILTGANNSGKSTILKAIYRLQDLNVLNQTDIRSMSYLCQIKIELSSITHNDRILFAYDKQKAPHKADTIFVIHKLNSNKTENKILADEENSNKLSIDEIDSISTEDFFSSEFTGLPKSEDHNNFIYPYFAKRKTSHYYSNNGKDNTFSVLDTLQNLPSKVQKIKSINSTKRDFDKYCNEILGFEIGVISGDNNELRLGIYTNNKNTIPIESMGEGVVNIIGIIVTILTENGKLYLIEELENDIHPLVLKKILDLIIIKSKNNQFVISTHSNIVLKYLGSLEESKIIFIESEVVDENLTYLPTSKLNEISNAPDERLRILAQLGYDLFDFDIYSAYLILEESSAERVIRNFIIPTFYPSMRTKLRTIAAQGVDDVSPKFNDLQRLFLYLHTSSIYQGKAWVIVDGDPAGQEVINKIIDKFPSWSKEHFQCFKEENFEMYYPLRFKLEVDKINSMANGQLKQKQKKLLLDQVMDWIEHNPQLAKNEFEQSAKEVIELLGEIANKV